MPKKKKNNLIITGAMQAKCACGEWHYEGILAEAKKAIEKVYEHHLWACKLKNKK